MTSKNKKKLIFQIKNENISTYKLIQRGFLSLNKKNILSINFLVGYFDTLQEAYDCKFGVHFSKRNDEIVLVVEKSLYDKKLEENIIYWHEWWNYKLNILNNELEKFSNKNIDEIFENENFYEEENFIPCSDKFEDIFSKYNMHFDKKQKYFLDEILETDETNIFPLLDENIFDEIL